MKRVILLAVVLTACQPANDGVKSPLKEELTQPALEPVIQEVVVQEVVVQEGIVRLRLNEPVSEPRACIIPIAIENGLDAATRVTMIAFNLTGPGDDAKGNMFAPAAGPGEISEARVIVEGQSCDAFDTISIPELRCTSGEESCADKIEFKSGEALKFSQSG